MYYSLVIVKGSGSTGAVSGMKSTFQLQFTDKYGNKCDGICGNSLKISIYKRLISSKNEDAVEGAPAVDLRPLLKLRDQPPEVEVGVGGQWVGAP